MIINKSCITAFSRTRPFVALATKSKLFDPSFSLTSELILANYMTGKIYPPITTDLKFCKLLWCETEKTSYLASGHENGVISLYELTEEGLVLVRSNEYMDGDVTALEYLPSKAVLVAGSCKGKIIFWTLTDLDKEYNLDIPMSAHITAIAWNAKVPKILCVGSADGSIKVLDIKKNSVIMTLTNKDISEVRAMEWDKSLSTKLLVLSDKPYLILFDLSTDSVTHIGNHSEPLIGFKDGILVSKNLIERGEMKINIKDAFDISFSQRDSVTAVSYADGTTEVFSIPSMPRKIPFFRRRNLIFTLGAASAQKNPLSNIEETLSAKKIVVPGEFNTGNQDDFYKSLIEMIRESKSHSEIAEFLLGMANNSEEDSDSGISVDLSDDEVLSLVKGNLDTLKNSNKSVALSHIYAIIAGDVEDLQSIDDLAILLVLSKIVGDYSALLNIKNQRILAAIVLFYDFLRDPSISSSTKQRREFTAICSLVSKDFGKYIDSRMGLCDYHLGNLGNVNQVMMELGDFVTGAVKLSSQCLIDYFWYKVFQGEYDDVKNLNIVDEGVEYYNNMMLGRGNTVLSGTSRPTKSVLFADKNPRFSQVPENRNVVERQAPWQNAGAAPSAPINANSPPVNTIPGQVIDFPGRQAAKIVPPVFPRKVSVEPITSSNVAGYSAPSPIHQRPVAPTSAQAMPGYPPISQQTGFQPPNVPRMNASFPSVPPRSPIPRLSTGAVSSGPAATGFPPTGVPSKGAMEGFSRQRSPNASSIPISRVKPVQTVPYPQMTTTLEQLHVTNVQASAPIDSISVVKRFDALVGMIRDRAATKNSLIIKQRKNQHLNALAVYDTINKSAIPIGVLEAMDALGARIETPDGSLKSDVDGIIAKQSDCVWLKAFVELVKLLY